MRLLLILLTIAAGGCTNCQPMPTEASESPADTTSAFLVDACGRERELPASRALGSAS